MTADNLQTVGVYFKVEGISKLGNLSVRKAWPRCQTTEDRRLMTADNLQTIGVYFKVEGVSKLGSLSGQEEGLAPAPT
jgi:hypothetical protein